MKSSECAARNWNRGIGLFLTLLTLKIFSRVHACIQITVKMKVTRHCITQFEEGTQLARKLRATCIARLADISFIVSLFSSFV
jgi:hypothetical protein